jgi:tetratricopeptide (TPR) repeat protein
MSEEQNSMLSKATDFINAGNFNEALETSRGILVGDTNNGDAKLIEAISLSQLGNGRDASEAFAAAIRLSPTNVKARFNAAVHEFNSGNVGQARTLASEALNLDPTHDGTKELVTRMGPEQPYTPGGINYPREGVGGFEPANEGIPFVKSLGSAWVLIGWALAALSAASFAYGLIRLAQNWGDLMSAMTSNDQAKIQQVTMAMSNPIMQILGYALIAFNMIWTIMDIIHRKGNFMWLIGHIPCTCVGLSFITQPLYILLGRK